MTNKKDERLYSSEELDRFTASADEAERCIAAIYGDDSCRNRLLKDPVPGVRFLVAQFGNRFHHDVLMKDRDENVRCAVARYGNDLHREFLLFDKSVSVRKNTVEIASFGQCVRVLNCPETPEEVLSHAIKRLGSFGYTAVKSIKGEYIPFRKVPTFIERLNSDDACVRNLAQEEVYVSPSDGFVWEKIEPSEAEKMFSKCELYKIYPDGSDGLIETEEELRRCIRNGMQVCREVGPASEVADQILYNGLDEREQLKMVSGDGAKIAFFFAPSEKVQLAAVKNCPEALGLIRNPKHSVRQAAERPAKNRKRKNISIMKL